MTWVRSFDVCGDSSGSGGNGNAAVMHSILSICTIAGSVGSNVVEYS